MRRDRGRFRWLTVTDRPRTRRAMYRGGAILFGLFALSSWSDILASDSFPLAVWNLALCAGNGTLAVLWWRSAGTVFTPMEAYWRTTIYRTGPPNQLPPSDQG